MLRAFCRSHKNVDHCIQSLTMKRFYCNKSVESAAKPSGTEPDEGIHRQMYQVTNFDRKLLVWVGRYKTSDEIPMAIPVNTITRARNKGRIKCANYMILVTVVGCIIMVWSGKRAAARGESVHKMNQDWHKAINEGEA